jgi:hypothetical protein
VKRESLPLIRDIIFEADELTEKPCWELATLVKEQKEGGKVVGILPGCVIGGWYEDLTKI